MTDRINIDQKKVKVNPFQFRQAGGYKEFDRYRTASHKRTIRKAKSGTSALYTSTKRAELRRAGLTNDNIDFLKQTGSFPPDFILRRIKNTNANQVNEMIERNRRKLNDR